MDTFDLNAALKGQPVKLRDGRKAYIRCDISVNFPNETYPLIGRLENSDFFTDWTKTGQYDTHVESAKDIVGMWNEETGVHGLPKPTTHPLNDGDIYYYVDIVKGEYRINVGIWGDSRLTDQALIYAGMMFATYDDCKQYCDFMQHLHKENLENE